jgi:hypothetical protein
VAKECSATGVGCSPGGSGVRDDTEWCGCSGGAVVHSRSVGGVVAEGEGVLDCVGAEKKRVEHVSPASVWANG